MVNTKKFSEFAAASLTTTTKKMAGISNTSGGENIIVDFTVEWTTSTRPSPPYDGLLGYNTDLKQYEYYDGTTAAWVQLADNAVFVNAKFIVQQPNAALPAAQALSALTTGILKSTTTTGVVSISAPLTSIDGLTTASDLMIYTTASNVYATTSLTAFARTLLAGTTAAAMRSTLGLGQAAVKNVTDNTKPNVASVTGSFVVNNVLLAGDTAGTVKDGGSPAGMGTVLEVDTGTGLTGGPITTTGTISFASIAANSLWVNNTAGAAVPAVTSLAALTEVDDTNVTMTLGGTPSTALINAVSMTLGWTGTLSPTRGGTGVADPTAHGIMVAEGSSAMTPIVLSSGQILIGSTGVDPVAAAINSGTGILVANGAGSITVNLAAIADHTLLANISGGALAPSSTTLTALIDNAIGSVQGDILYRNATVWTVLAPGSSGQLLKTGGAAANPSWTTSTFPSTGGATGNILISDGTNYIASTSLWPNTVGNAGTILRSNGTSNAYSTSTFADTYAVSTILYASGANAVSGLTTANSSVLVTTSAGVPVQSGTMTNGQLIIGSTGATPAVASLSAGTGISITPGAGTISIATTGAVVTPAALSKTDDTNVTLTLTGTPSTALLQATTITAGWTGQLGLTRGGTAASLTASNGGIIYSTASALAVLAGTATANQILMSGASTTPAWSTTTYPGTNAINTIMYASSANVLGVITPVNSAVLISSAGGVPSMSTTLPSGIAATNMALTTPNIGVATATSITFGGTALANYVEGTYTPTVTLVGGAGNTVPQYSTNSGNYTRIGNRVFCDIYLTGDGGNEGAGTGQITITLPVNYSGSALGGFYNAGNITNGATTNNAYFQLTGGGTQIALYYESVLGTISSATGTQQNNTTRTIRLTFEYQV